LATKKAKKEIKKQNAVQRFVRETIGELKKVTWPTSREAWQLTQVVLAVLLIMAVFLGLIVDGIARQLLKLLLGG
jgi:preprotein translocase subunit SecE